MRLTRPVAVLALTATTLTAAAIGLRSPARAQAPAAACKAFGGGKCCEPAVTAHLTKDAIFSACGESEATFLGEKGGKDTCRYVFKGDGQGEAFVEVYAPAQTEVPSSPNDPFFSWKKIGKVFMTDKAKTPKMAGTLANSTGLWMPGKGFFVSVNASTKVCSKAEAQRLARAIR